MWVVAKLILYYPEVNRHFCLAFVLVFKFNFILFRLVHIQLPTFNPINRKTIICSTHCQHMAIQIRQ